MAVGGIVGRVSSSEASLENCYNVGEIKYEENISSSYIGGICGEGSNIKNVYSIGKLENTLKIVEQLLDMKNLKEQLKNINKKQKKNTHSYSHLEQQWT